MGPSGSGKTSLISILGGRKPPSMTVTGDVSFNGVPLSRMLQSSMGFVLQDDILFDSLTVYETLYFAARLRLPHDMSLCAAPLPTPPNPAMPIIFCINSRSLYARQQFRSRTVSPGDSGAAQRLFRCSGTESS